MVNICKFGICKNIWAILENLSRETKNLNFDIYLFLLTCYKSCFSYLSCTPKILLKKYTSCKLITKLLLIRNNSTRKQVIRNEKKHSHNKVSYNYLCLQLKQITIEEDHNIHTYSLFV